MTSSCVCVCVGFVCVCALMYLRLVRPPRRAAAAHANTHAPPPTDMRTRASHSPNSMTDAAPGCGGTPVDGFPGVFKLSGKERFAIVFDESETRIVKSWRTVLRYFARKAKGETPPPPPPPPPPPAPASPIGKRTRVRPVPFDPTSNATPPRPRAAKRKVAPASDKEKVEEKVEEQEEAESASSGDDELDHTASGGARHWTPEEDNVMLTWMVRLGMAVGKPASEANWRKVTENVCKIRFRTLRQVRRRWGFLNPANGAANEATRARRRDQDRVRRKVAQELFPKAEAPAKKQKKKKKEGPDGVPSEALTDGMVDEALAAFVAENDAATLALSAIEPPLDDDDRHKHVKRLQTDPAINYQTTQPWQLTGPPRATPSNALEYEFTEGLARSKPFSFRFPPDTRLHIDGRRKYENLILAVPAAELPLAAMHQNQITDYLLQRKKRAGCASPLLKALQEKTPSGATEDEALSSGASGSAAAR